MVAQQLELRHFDEEVAVATAAAERASDEAAKLARQAKTESMEADAGIADVFPAARAKK